MVRKKSEEFLFGAKEHLTAEGKDFMVHSAKKFHRELQFRREQWMSTNDTWEKLIESYLSDKYVDNWGKDSS